MAKATGGTDTRTCMCVYLSAHTMLQLPTLLGGLYPQLYLIRGTLWGLLSVFPEAPASMDAREDEPLKVTRSSRRRLISTCWSTSCSVWKQICRCEPLKNSTNVIYLTTALKLCLQTTTQKAEGINAPFYCNIVLHLGSFFSSPVYDCVPFLLPRPVRGSWSLQQVSPFLFEPVSALHPSAPTAVPVWWELPKESKQRHPGHFALNKHKSKAAENSLHYLLTSS